MSHVAVVACQIRDLDALSSAAEKLGGELRRNQTRFQMYGSESQACVHAIGVKGARNGAYEIGLRRKSASDEAEGYELACDFFDGSLATKFGANLVGLRNEYQAVVAERTLQRRGYRVQRQDEGQQIRLVARA